MKKTFIFGLMLALLLGACSTRVIESPPEPAANEPAASETGAVEIANPASQNCIEKGGTLSIEERGDGGQYGICYFEDNRQCEEWALMRGDCPVGGLKVTGYVTPAARYCVISGGSYAIGAGSGADDEQGTCTFKDGSACDVWDFYNGKCSPGQLPAPTAAPPQQLRLGQLVFDFDPRRGKPGPLPDERRWIERHAPDRGGSLQLRRTLVAGWAAHRLYRLRPHQQRHRSDQFRRQRPEHPERNPGIR